MLHFILCSSQVAVLIHTCSVVVVASRSCVILSEAIVLAAIIKTNRAVWASTKSNSSLVSLLLREGTRGQTLENDTSVAYFLSTLQVCYVFCMSPWLFQVAYIVVTVTVLCQQDHLHDECDGFHCGFHLVCE